MGLAVMVSAEYGVDFVEARRLPWREAFLEGLDNHNDVQDMFVDLAG